jgi:hypothetical protein
MKRVALLLGGLAACTAQNPDYIRPGSDLAGRDLAVAGDLRGADLATGGRDQAMGGCTLGQRRCAGTAVEVCMGGAFVLERRCPEESACRDGVCDAPPRKGGTTQGQDCMSESQCYVSAQTFDYSCAPFVAEGGKKVELVCAHLVGQGGSGNACAAGAECRSGICLLDRKTCFRACWGDPDCPFRNNIKTVCREVTFLVDGVAGKARSCILP